MTVQSLFEVPKGRWREFVLALLGLVWEYGGNDWVAKGVLFTPQAYRERGTVAKARLIIAQDSNDHTIRWEDPAYNPVMGLLIRKLDFEVIEFQGYLGSPTQELLSPRATLEMMIDTVRQGFSGPIFIYTEAKPGHGHPPREWMKIENDQLELGLFEKNGGKPENLVFLLRACETLGLKQLVPA